MAKLIIHQEKVTDNQELVKICPFGAMEEKDGKLTINAACKMCRLCVKKGPEGAVEYVEDTVRPSVDKEEWKGIAVYVDHVDSKIHPVTLELLGKARELAQVTGHPVYALFMGNDIGEKCHELLHYGADKVFVYDEPELARFKIEPYTAVFEDFIQNVKPSSILVGATTVGRQLAPRVAARMKTGLTADCTILEMNEDTDLSQIRPAFGGNIMAHIKTPDHRPQMATVRYKIMNAPERSEEESGEIVNCSIAKERLGSHVDVLDIVLKKCRCPGRSRTWSEEAGGPGDASKAGRSSGRTACLYQTDGRVRMASCKMSDRLKRPYGQTETHHYLWGVRGSSVHRRYESFGKYICN